MYFPGGPNLTAEMTILEFRLLRGRNSQLKRVAEQNQPFRFGKNICGICLNAHTVFD